MRRQKYGQNTTQDIRMVAGQAEHMGAVQY